MKQEKQKHFNLKCAINNFFSYNIPGKRKRIWELDILRGIILWIVTFDHCCLFTAYWGIMPYQTEFGAKLMEISLWYCNCAFRKGIEPFGLFFLCFLSGINTNFTRSSFRRVIKFWIFCAVFMGGYACFHFIFPTILTGTLIFNIITILTLSFTLWWILDLIKCPTWVRSLLGILIICIGITGFYKHFIDPNHFFIENKFLALLIYNENGYILSPNNFEPLFPHMGWFLIGGVVGKFIYPQKKTLCKQEDPPEVLYPILWAGKHSLSVFLFAPIVILGIERAIVAIVAWFL